MDDNDKKSQDIFERMRWLDSFQPLKKIISPSLMAVLNSRNSPLLDRNHIHQINSIVKDSVLTASYSNINEMMKNLVGNTGYPSINTMLKDSIVTASYSNINEMVKNLVGTAGYSNINAMIKDSIGTAGFSNLNSHMKSLVDNTSIQTLLKDKINIVSNSFFLLQKMLEVVDCESKFDDEINASLFLDFNGDSSIQEQILFENDVQSVANDLFNDSGSVSFIDRFKKLSLNTKIIMVFLLLNFVFPQVNNIFSFYVNRYLESEFSVDSVSNREAIEEVKSLSEGIQLVDFSSLRFINGKGVRLRESNSIKADILDIPNFGQVVEVHSIEKSWIEVSYQYEDGTYMNGWVYLPHTSRFVK